MKTIYKYEILSATGGQSVEMPENAKIVRVDKQGEYLFIWAEIDTDSPLVYTEFCIYGTGHRIEEGLTYFTTYLDGPYVLHFYI